jgi:hypothetical protein
VKIELYRRNHAAGAQQAGLRPQHPCGIGHVHQNQPPDDRVERPVRRSVMDIADNEPNVGQATLSGARQFCAIRSYLSTAAKHGLNFFDALVMLTEGQPWMPATA